MDNLPKPSREANEELLKREGAVQRKPFVFPPMDEQVQPLKVELGEQERDCEKHGAYMAKGTYLRPFDREIWSQCAACLADAEAARQEAEAADAQRRMKAAREAAIGESDLPPRFQDRDFARFVADTDAKRRAASFARAFAEDFALHSTTGAGLIFAGMPGTGKSHLAAAVMLALLGRYSAKYVTCMGLIRLVRDTWRRDSEVSERALLRMLCEDLDLLVIDEVGVQYGTDGEQTILFEVLDRRYSGMKPTILITNQDREGFKTFVGDRVYDRLRETARWIPFDWESYRAVARNGGTA